MSAVARDVVGVLLVLTGLGVALVGCRSQSGEGFALYLLAGDPPPSELASLSHVEPAGPALISGDGLISYTRATHEIQLPAAVYTALVHLEVPLQGRSFAVCVDGEVVYTGAFVVDLWSGSFDGVVIVMPPTPEVSPERFSLSLELGYPGSAFFSGKDPRADASVLEALARVGKLR